MLSEEPVLLLPEHIVRGLTVYRAQFNGLLQ